MTVIASDGFSIEPIVVDSLALSPGERYDVVMHATSDPNIGEICQFSFLILVFKF